MIGGAVGTTARAPRSAAVAGSASPAVSGGGSGPGLGSTAAVTIAVALSSTPSLLPRSALTQAVVTGVFAAIALAVTALARRRATASGRRYPDRTPAGTELRWLCAAVAAAVTVVCAAGAHRWQNGLRSAMSLPPIGIRHWLEVASGAVVTTALCVGLVVGGRRALRAGWRGAAAPAVALTALVAAAVVPKPPAAQTHTPPAVASGSSDALLGWETLGEHGQRFVSAVAPIAPLREGTPIAPLREGTPTAPLRVYASLASADDAASRAALAVRDLERAGGFAREHLVVAVPTGSGWVDEAAVRGFEDRWGDAVAVVAQQYSDTPSWVTFLFDRDAAAEAATALVDAVRARSEALPPGSRPQLHVYGQSLGAVGGSAVFADRAPGPCEALWAGPPAGAVRTDGASVVANTSDPVVWWRPALLWSPPDLSRARVDAPVPPWLPVIGFVQTTVDLLTSLDLAPGHGHRYGPEQARCETAAP